MLTTRTPGAALAWGSGWFCCLQLVLSVLMECGYPELRDLEYARKLDRLIARREEHPVRPLLVVLGSSRVSMGLRPDLLNDCPPYGQSPLVHNLGFIGGGPVRERLCLHQLLREGLRPDWLVVEIHPCLLHYVPGSLEDCYLQGERLGWQDLAVLWRYAHRARRLGRGWLTARLVPSLAHRLTILSGLAPRWLPPESREDGWHGLDAHGWLCYPKLQVSEEEYEASAEAAYRQYRSCFSQFGIAKQADAALRELLATCRSAGIAVLLLTMPEGSAFQSWYPPATQDALHAHLTGLSREYGIPWIDARSWVADDGFWDGHHLLRDGATVFTERFRREVLLPWTQGLPLPLPPAHESLP